MQQITSKRLKWTKYRENKQQKPAMNGTVWLSCDFSCQKTTTQGHFMIRFSCQKSSACPHNSNVAPQELLPDVMLLAAVHILCI